MYYTLYPYNKARENVFPDCCISQKNLPNIFTEKYLCLSGPVQVKSVLFKGQLH